ncbi:structural cement protein Gp24 [Sinorhizobium meliloti]|uniref:structural cement protein Gp24 n=1 Tax=Rhizobium meliloti TaxID=382 RepID=UPI003B528DCF
MATYQTTYTNAPPKGCTARSLPRRSATRSAARSRSWAACASVSRFSAAPRPRCCPLRGQRRIHWHRRAEPGRSGGCARDSYPRYFTGAFMTMGTMYVTAGGAVAQGDAVFYNTLIHRYVNAAGVDIVGPIPDAVFDTSGANGAIVEIALRLRASAPAA